MLDVDGIVQLSMMRDIIHFFLVCQIDVNDLRSSFYLYEFK